MQPPALGNEPALHGQVLLIRALWSIFFPHLEHAELYKAVNQSLTIAGDKNTTVHAVAVAAYACPSDPEAGWPRPLGVEALADPGVPDPPAERHRMVLTNSALVQNNFSN